MNNISLYLGITALIINYIFFIIYITQLRLSSRDVTEVNKNKKLLEDNILDSNQLISSRNNLELTVVIPAYNEQETICKSVSSFLSQRYDNLKIYVVNDGSKDNTKRECLDYFHMEKIPLLKQQSDIFTQPVKGIYQSQDYPNIYLIDKENGGKSDALNVGVNYATSDYVAFVDADSFVEEDALVTLMSPFYFSDDIVSIGGQIRPMTRIENFSKRSMKIRTTKILPSFQYLEYLRSVLVFRSSLSKIESTVIISGAFGVYDITILREIDGLDTDSIGEDFDLTLSIRKYLNDRKIDKRQIFLYDSVCWTQPPSRIRDVVKQRSRWQIGFLQTVWKHKGMVFNRRYKNVGMVGLPLFIFTEFVSFLMETVGLVLGGYFLATGIISWREAIYIFLLSYFVNLFFTMAVILQNARIQNISYKDKLFLMCLGLVEAFSYHWVSLYSKFKGTVKFLFTGKKAKHDWGDIKRDEVV